MTSYAIPVGPLHVALEEPMYFKVDVEGETVTGVDITAGHVHRGVEYLLTKRTIFQGITLTERVCSLCSNSHPQAYCMGIEKIAGIEVPPRAEHLRVVADEIKRIASHLFNVGIMAHLIGLDSLFMHAMEVREIMQDVKETIFGNRMDIGANVIGGVRYDMDDGQIRWVLTQLDRLESALEEIYGIYASEGAILGRTQGIGVFLHADAVEYGVAGPVARAAGIDYDVRVKSPYAAYDTLKVAVPVRTAGDVWSRAMIRLEEARISIGLLRTVLAQLPDGPTAPAERPDEFPAGESVAKCEAPRGELIYYVRTNGSDRPERVKWRVPSYMNWEALCIMLKGAHISDIALIVNSIDPCISCTER